MTKSIFFPASPAVLSACAMPPALLLYYYFDMAQAFSFWFFIFLYKRLKNFLPSSAFVNSLTSRSGWQCVSAQIVAPKSYYGIQVGVFYERNANTAMFTNISLTRGLYGNVYTYDAKGNITAVKDLSNQKSAATYDSFDNLLSYVQPGSATTEKYLFTYGSTDAEKKRHLPLTSTTPTGVKTMTEYNAYGSAINATVQENASAPLIRTETEYTEDGNFVTKQRDARGNEVVNTFDANGKLLSVTDPSGQSVNYGYDASNRVTSVQSAYTVNGESRISRNEYTYENDKLKTVAHNTTGDEADVVYNFEYDELGRKTTVKVGNQALSTNVYSPDRKSRLEEVQYGNGRKVKYTYDDFDRVTGVGYDNDESSRFSYEYDSKGRAAFVKDSTDGSTVRTGYDQTDRPNEAEQRDGEGNLKYRTLIEYDKKNRVKAFNEATADQSFKTEYTYDADNRVTKVRYNSSDTSKVDYVYDKLNRITSRTVTNGTSAYATQYAYAPGAVVYGENATTPLVSSITQGEGENAMNFAYTYDNRGNITSETRNGLTTTYVYDALGQLVRVNEPHENATWIYSYDRGGNILNKAKYAYTIADELGEALESIPYTYGDANWKDKLTAYNGISIVYDAMGNPLNDGTWTYEWQAGRQLKRMSAEGTALTFQYDHNGLRTQKVVEADWYPETTNYYLHGKLLTHMTVDYRDTSEAAHQDVMHFFYDAQSRPAKVSFNGTVYTYIHNLQGDVVGLLDNSGTLVVEYKYDAWGKAIATTGSMAATLGKRNPFRYRGYIYDEETGLYYLRSRYYNPVVGRFVNEDGAIIPGLLSTNMFAYCSNNPLSMVDTSGCRGENIFQRAGNWLSGLLNKIGDEIKYQTKIQTEVNIRMAKSADEKLSKAENWVKKKASDVGDWWNGSAKPWIEQAWEDVGKSIKDALRAQQQADILSAQMTYHAASTIGDWVSDNWRSWLATFENAWSWTTWLATGCEIVGLVALPKTVVVGIWIVESAFKAYHLGEGKWW